MYCRSVACLFSYPKELQLLIWVFTSWIKVHSTLQNDLGENYPCRQEKPHWHTLRTEAEIPYTRPGIYENTIPTLPGISWASYNQKLSVENRYIGFMLNFLPVSKVIFERSTKNRQKWQKVHRNWTFMSLTQG